MDKLYSSVATLVAMVTRDGLSGNQTPEIQNRKVKPTVWGGGGYSGMLGIQRVLSSVTQSFYPKLIPNTYNSFPLVWNAL